MSDSTIGRQTRSMPESRRRHKCGNKRSTMCGGPQRRMQLEMRASASPVYFEKGRMNRGRGPDYGQWIAELHRTDRLRAVGFVGDRRSRQVPRSNNEGTQLSNKTSLSNLIKSNPRPYIHPSIPLPAFSPSTAVHNPTVLQDVRRNRNMEGRRRLSQCTVAIISVDYSQRSRKIFP